MVSDIQLDIRQSLASFPKVSRILCLNLFVISVRDTNFLIAPFIIPHSSCWSTTTGRIVGLVCIRWIIGTNIISRHVRIHCILLFDGSIVCGTHWSAICFHCVHPIGAAYINVTVNIRRIFLKQQPCQFRHIQSFVLLFTNGIKILLTMGCKM